MRHLSVYALSGVCLIALGAISDLVVPRLPIAQSHILPIQGMPRTVGEWKAAKEDRPISEEVQEKLKTARFIDRIYSDPAGRTVELLLVSADDKEDIHDPQVCFPGQGWKLNTMLGQTLSGQKTERMRASQGGINLDVLYWFGGYHPPQLPSSSLIRRIATLRTQYVKGEGISLFVRLMTARSDTSEQTLEAFATRILPEIRRIEAASSGSKS